MKMCPSTFLVLLLNLDKHLMMISGNQQFFLFQLQRPPPLFCRDLHILDNVEKESLRFLYIQLLRRDGVFFKYIHLYACYFTLSLVDFITIPEAKDSIPEVKQHCGMPFQLCNYQHKSAKMNFLHFYTLPGVYSVGVAWFRSQK